MPGEPGNQGGPKIAVGRKESESCQCPRCQSICSTPIPQRLGTVAQRALFGVYICLAAHAPYGNYSQGGGLRVVRCVSLHSVSKCFDVFQLDVRIQTV